VCDALSLLHLKGAPPRRSAVGARKRGRWEGGGRGRKKNESAEGDRLILAP